MIYSTTLSTYSCCSFIFLSLRKDATLQEAGGSRLDYFPEQNDYSNVGRTDNMGSVVPLIGMSQAFRFEHLTPAGTQDTRQNTSTMQILFSPHFLISWLGLHVSPLKKKIEQYVMSHYMTWAPYSNVPGSLSLSPTGQCGSHLAGGVAKSLTVEGEANMAGFFKDTFSERWSKQERERMVFFLYFGGL